MITLTFSPLGVLAAFVMYFYAALILVLGWNFLRWLFGEDPVHDEEQEALRVASEESLRAKDG
jgi:hypothetical protein